MPWIFLHVKNKKKHWCASWTWSWSCFMCIYIYIYIIIYIYIYIYIWGCVKIRVWIGPRWSRRMDRSGSPAFWYGSGVWIACGFRVWIGALHFDLQPYIHTYNYIHIFIDIHIFIEIMTRDVVYTDNIANHCVFCKICIEFWCSVLICCPIVTLIVSQTKHHHDFTILRHLGISIDGATPRSAGWFMSNPHQKNGRKIRAPHGWNLHFISPRCPGRPSPGAAEVPARRGRLLTCSAHSEPSDLGHGGARRSRSFGAEGWETGIYPIESQVRSIYEWL